MYRAMSAILALVATAQAQEAGAPDSLDGDNRLEMRVDLREVTSANDSAQDGPAPEKVGLTGAELLQGLQAAKELPQLEMLLEELDKDIMASTRLDFWKVLGILRASIFGGEVAWLKENDFRRAEVEKVLASARLATASSEFVKAIHDTERGVSFSCPPDHTMAEMFEIVRVSLRENPREQRLPAEISVVNALKARWPKTGEGPAAKETGRSLQKPEAQ